MGQFCPKFQKRGKRQEKIQLEAVCTTGGWAVKTQGAQSHPGRTGRGKAPTPGQAFKMGLRHPLGPGPWLGRGPSLRPGQGPGAAGRRAFQPARALCSHGP